MIGIFGGSFDPIHFGHIKLVLALIERYKFDQIRMIPCYQSPFNKPLIASVQQRWEMLNLVTDSHDKLVADSRELERQGSSYTIDTITELKREIEAEVPLVLIIGIDAFISFCKWHRYDEILTLSHIMLLQRPGYRLPDKGCEKDLFDKYITEDIKNFENMLHGKIYLTDLEKFDISSTTIRKCVSQGDQPRYLLPGNIWDYIKKSNLYK